MRSRITRLSRARIVALALGVGALGSLAVAPAAFAAGAAPQPPLTGSNCAADGHISGAGSTFQTNGVNDGYTYGYMLDVCGRTPNPSNLNSTYTALNYDPSQFNFGTPNTSVQGMVAYNYTLGVGGTAASNGSGNGILRMECRTDFFSGTDLPYNNSQLTAMNGSNSGVACGGLNTSTVPPPFGPQTSVGYPNTNDTAKGIMSFPIADGAVENVVNLNGVCTTQPTGTLNLTADEFNKIWQGTINQWNDPELVATDPFLSTDGCTGNIQRVVRFDNSGTTAIMMFTLYGIDLNNSEGAGADLCGTDNTPQPATTTSTTWYQIATSSSNAGKWPQFAGTGGSYPDGDCVDGSGNHALNTINSGTSGSPPLIALLKTTNGGIGYAETGLWGTLPAGVLPVNLQTLSDFNVPGNGLGNPTPAADSTGTTFKAPGTPAHASNCSLNPTPNTGSQASQAVGLGSTTWSNTSASTSPPLAPGAQDIAWDKSLATGYPACGLTFDMVYTGQTEAGEIGGPGGTAGCTSNPATTTPGQALNTTTLTVASTAGFPTSGTVEVTNGTTLQYLTYTGITGTSFTGIPTTGAGSGTGTAPASAAVTLITGACQTVTGPLQGATNDQLRTMYAYFTYMFSPLGQSGPYLPPQTLDPLPVGWYSVIQTGFQQAF